MRVRCVPPCVVVALAASVAFGGEITPPAGVVQGTGKTLTDIEPRRAITTANTPGNANADFRITTSGSYYLTQNHALQANNVVIEIAASDVTIDLNGFTIVGSIGVTSVVSNVTIRNGTVSALPGGTGFIGLRQGGNGGDLSTIENVTVRNASTTVINVGENSVLRNVRVRGATGTVGGFIIAGARATMSDVLVENPQTIGSTCVAAGASSVLRNVVTLGGSQGITVGANSNLQDCRASLSQQAAGAGIVLGVGCTATNCVSTSNQGKGFDLANNCRLTSCEASENFGGGFIDVNANSVLFTNCIADGNFNEPNFRAGGFVNFVGGTSRGGSAGGVELGFGARIDAMTVVNTSGAPGINILSGNIVNCQVVQSSAGGIVAGARSFIQRTTVNNGGNPGIGIRMTAFPGRIEDSNIFNCATGYQCDAPAIVIVRNQFNGNTVDGLNAGGAVIFGPFILNSGDLSDPSAPAGNYNP